MYYSTEHAREELKKRRTDLSLRRKVETWLGTVPEFLRGEPRAVLARHLATPNFEFFRFAEAARKLGLRPACSEYAGDKFCAGNPDKLLLGKMTFFHGKGRKEGDNVSCHKVINFNKFNGKPFAQVSTLWGEGFVGFHHRLLAAKLPEIATADISQWISVMGGTPAKFWHRLLSLFVCHGILFENIHLEGHEAAFTREIIQPAIVKVETLFGVRPLIVTSVPIEREREPYWAWYPGELESEVGYLTTGRTGEKWYGGGYFAGANEGGAHV